MTAGRRFAIPSPSSARVSLVTAWCVQHRDGFACAYCGAVVADLHVDHVRPLAHFPAGAPDHEVNDPRNLVAACPDCNQAKGPQNLPGFAAMLRGRGLPARVVAALVRRANASRRRPLPNPSQT